MFNDIIKESFGIVNDTITKLDISKIDKRITKASVINYPKSTDLLALFMGCDSLVSIDLSNFDTNRVKNMANMFRHCSSLSSLNLSNFNTHKVKDMIGMFWNCSSLISLDLSNFDTSAFTEMCTMFWGCNALKELKTSDRKILKEYEER